jgi:hypothetical protein
LKKFVQITKPNQLTCSLLRSPIHLAISIMNVDEALTGVSRADHKISFITATQVFLIAGSANARDDPPPAPVRPWAPPTNGNLPNVEIVGGGNLLTQSLPARGELTAR